MKIAVSAQGRNLNSTIDPRFGRCANFLIVNTEDMSFEVFDNDNRALSGGAGIQAAQFVVSKGAKVVITGNLGPNAVQALKAAGVEMITGQTETVIKAINDYKDGKLEITSETDATRCFVENISSGIGQGMGRGRGRGMGRGRGW
jgi:predicted Fe-Mo cluster-binding NifX family protein